METNTDRQMITKTDKQHAILVSVIVKAPDKEAAEEFARERMTEWFNDTEPRPGKPFYNGTLLHWNFYEPRVINGR